MKRNPIGPRAGRSLQLLMGMRLPRVAEALASHGFGRQTIDQGWRLLQALTAPGGEGLTVGGGQPLVQPELEECLLLWLPLAFAVLRAPYPQQAQQIAYGLAAERGRMAPIYLGTFLDRLDAMDRGESPYLDKGPLASELLAQRGISREERRSARTMVRNNWLPPEANTSARSEAQDQAAMLELWHWYREWSAICRLVIKNKTLLNALGLRPQRKKRKTPITRRVNLPTVRVLRERAQQEESSPRRLPAGPKIKL